MLQASISIHEHLIWWLVLTVAVFSGKRNGHIQMAGFWSDNLSTRFWNLQEQNSSSWIEGAAKKIARFQSHSGDTVAAGYDTVVKILDVTTERELRTIGDAHDKPINAITWSPNVCTPFLYTPLSVD